MKEKDVQVKIKRFLDSRLNTFENGAYELKLTKTNTILFTDFRDHQIKNLLKVKHSGLYYKISDTGYSQKPFDFIVLKGNAYVVIAFYKPRKQLNAYIIDIDAYVSYISSREHQKSLREAECKDLAILRLDLLKESVIY